MKVFKYRYGDEETFSRDVKSLENNIFWAPTRNKLNDPCEGMVTEKILLNQIDIIVKILGKNKKDVYTSAINLKESIADMLDKRNTSGIYSLSRSNTDELLWAHYANSHHGFCIEYDLETLLYFGRSDYLKFDIKYKEKPPKLTIKDMLNIHTQGTFIQKLIGIKSKKWKYEQELRIVTSLSGENTYDFRAVRAIHFGLRMPDEKVTKVMQLLNGRDIKYYQVELKESSYKLTSNLIEDRFPTDEKYLYSISPIAEFAITPDSLNKKWKGLSPYLGKMAEIVRREPYCDEVLLVDISYEKSKPEEPVFFGQYQRSKYRYENLYLTPKEIDRMFANIYDLESVVENV